MELLRQKWNPPSNPNFSFVGKTVIVTGGSSGLGYEAALKFVEKGASKVILAVRSLSSGQAAKDAIEAKSGRSNTVDVWELEMGDYDSLKKFAEKAEALESVDIVVLNAGVVVKDYRVGRYGWETTLQINVLSTVLLAILLLRKLRASKTSQWTPVLEIVSSGLYRAVEVFDAVIDHPLEAYNDPQAFKSQQQYNRSKLLVQCAVKALARLAQQNEDGVPDVVVSSVCPGACRTTLGREFMTNWLIRLSAEVFFALFFRTAEQGARTLVSGTTQGEKANGGFWKDDILQPDHSNISGPYGKKLIDAVWNDVVRALGQDVPEITALLE